MFTHLLCAVDESLEARRACAVAADLSSDLELETALLNVIPEHDGLAGTGLPAHDRQARELGARQLLADAAADNGLEPIACNVAVGSPSQEIVRIADEQHSELIVVGSRGRGEFHSAVLGSVSATVTQKASCPVIVVPARLEGTERIDASRSAVVCGVEDADHDASALTLAGRLAERLGGELHAVHVYSEPPIAAGVPFAPAYAPAAMPPAEDLRACGEQMLADAMSRAGVHGEPSVIEADDPAEALDEAARDKRARLIVVGSHRRGRLAAALIGSVSRRLAIRSATPVVVLPPTVSPSGA